MAQRYAVYLLKKVANKKEYVVSEAYIFSSLKAAYHDLEVWDEDLDDPVTFNPQTGEFVSYRLYDRMLCVPKWTLVEDDSGFEERRLVGVYARFPIYYIDKYPNPYSYYTLHKVRGFNELYLEGVE